MATKLKSAFNTLGRKWKKENKNEAAQIDTHTSQTIAETDDTEWKNSDVWTQSTASWILPIDLWVEILLIVEDVRITQTFACVCKHFRNVVTTRDDIFQRFFFKQRNSQKAILCGMYKWKDVFQNRSVQTSVMSCLDRVEHHLRTREKEQKSVGNYLATFLFVSDLEIPVIPEKVFSLASLQRLNLVRNHMQMVPKQLARLTNLTTLNLASNELSSLPENLVELVQLKTLILSQNKFTQIPVIPVCKLASLTKLVFANNKLRGVPEELVELVNLQHLSLAHNQEFQHSLQNVLVLQQMTNTELVLDGILGEWSTHGLNIVEFLQKQ